MRRFYTAILFAVLCLWTGVGVVQAQTLDNSRTIVYIDGVKYYVHTVAAGETLYSVAKSYGSNVDDVVKLNPSAADGLRPDMVLKIPFVNTAATQQETKKKRKDFDFYTVSAGETLYSVSRQFGISIDTVLEDNPDVDPSQLSVGTRLYIRKSAVGTLQSADVHEEWMNYRDNMNAVAPEGYFYYMVQSGDTLYSLSRRYGITEQELLSLNELPEGLKAGGLLMLPLPEGQKASDEAVHEYDAESQKEEIPEGRNDDDELQKRFGYRLGYGFVTSGHFRAVESYRPVRVALLLPMTKNGGAVNAHYMDFYRGFLLGAEEVKAAGYSMVVTLFDTEQSTAKVASIVESGFDDSQPDLIVGPVYENELAPVVEFAERNGIPVVSPLASLASTDSRVVFQMSPDGARKYDKVADLFDGSREVTLVYGESVDRDFEREVLSMLDGRRFATHKYAFEHQSIVERRERARASQGLSNSDKPSGPSDLSYLLRGGRNNVIVVLADNETEVDRILAAIASADISLRTRERNVGRFVVMGSSKWQRYANLDHSIFFSDKVILLSSYSARRDDERVRKFDDRYITDFEALPSLYTYRGYDAAVIFGLGMFGDIESNMEGRRYKPLQTSYTFERSSGGRMVNTEWMRTDYRDNFTTNVE